jgi:1-acyl-sn-glycerol-3-phosphate acyltransferase
VKAPPTLLRRVLIAPLILGAELALLLFSPLLAAVSALLSLLTGGRRPIRVLAMALTWAGGHVLSVLACWLLLATREDRSRYYAVMRWFVGTVAQAVIRAARVKVSVVDSERAEAVVASETPVVVLSIHSGEGDSLLVLDHLLRRHRRRPRIVMHQALAVDPLIDMLGRHLPNRFVDPRGGDIEGDIADMSRDLAARDAVLIFPEGGNFTQERRRRSIERLLHRGHHEQAEQARDMEHLAAPRPGGALAALSSAPQADVILMAHYGVPTGFRDAWRRLSDRIEVEVQLWHVPASELPDGDDERIRWLFGWWETLDAWVAVRRLRDGTGDQQVAGGGRG